MYILTSSEVKQALDGAEQEVLQAVGKAYLLHAQGRTTVPHSVFLRFPEPQNRIIALPAYLGSDSPVAGIKWISSFPDNVQSGLDRASAAIILNSMATGRPEALLEGSTISAWRTAASAALAASTLAGDRPDSGVSMIGCGVINFTVLSFLLVALPDLGELTLFDTDPARAQAFAQRCDTRWPKLKVTVAGQLPEALSEHRLISLATTALAPHLTGDDCLPGTLALHLSLRDFTPGTILSAVNVVDDADHVCRAGTSIYLAEQQVAHREFIGSSLGEILLAGRPYRRPEDALTIFSPFGLGMLDLAVAALVRQRARARGLGRELADFLPEPD
jgi:N-[(2S)-2-amino-2-carboxyethyl]-L-glutamate dehydrogenase